MQKPNYKLPNTKNIYFHIRHAQTLYNKQGRYQGTLDIDLDSEGVKQAKNLVLPKQYDLIFSSPLKRSISTAIISTNKYPLIDERLKEKSGGKIEGMYFSDIFSSFPEVQHNSTHNLRSMLSIELPNGESDYHVIHRVYSFISDIESKFSSNRILIFGHYGTAIAFRYIFGKNKKQIFSHSNNGQIELFGT